MTREYPEDLKYLDSHEYVRLEGEIATIGISRFAVDQLGDIVFVELPEVGTTFDQGESFGTVESVKAVETLISPLTGTVVEVNQILNESPELVGDDPYGEGWFVKIRVVNPSEIQGALNADQYCQLVEGS